MNIQKMFFTLVLVLLASVLFARGEAETDTITFWTTEEQPERIAVQEEISARFNAETGITVQVIPVSENQMGERVTAAFAAGELPDVIYFPLNFALNWAEAGILDIDAADAIVDELGRGTFGAGVINLVDFNGKTAAVPVDGWTQLLVYREDLFAENGLQPPSDYDSIRTAIRALHNPPEFYGFVAATDASQVYMMQVFEHIALANGVDIVDDRGAVTVNTPAMIETLEFYKELAQASPPGNLFWQQSRELYLGGKAAMIVWSPFIMDELAGLRDSAPVTINADPTSRDLAAKTNFLTTIGGPSNRGGSGWTDVRYFGITADAAVNAASEFVRFSMEESYLQTLSVAPEGKFPVRKGTADDPDKFTQGWSQLEVGVDRRARLSDIYSPDVIANLTAGLETGSRWGFDKGYGNLTSKLYETRVFAELVRSYIDDEISAAEAASMMQAEAEALNN